LFSLRKISVSLLIVFLPLTGYSGNPYRFPNGAAGAGMGSLCTIRQGFWSSFNNPALLSYNQSFMAGVNYENRFFMSELSTRTIGVILPAGNASAGIHYSNFGYSNFRRESAGIASGLMLSENISAGIRLDYLSEKTSGEYDNHRHITFEAGITFTVPPGVIIGVKLFNPLPNSLRESGMPSSLSAGAGLELGDALFAGAEAEMVTGGEINLRTGFEYEVVKSFWLRGGFSTENSSFSFGLGYLLRSVRIDLSFATHEKLGVTTGVSLIIKIR